MKRSEGLYTRRNAERYRYLNGFTAHIEVAHCVLVHLHVGNPIFVSGVVIFFGVTLYFSSEHGTYLLI